MSTEVSSLLETLESTSMPRQVIGRIQFIVGVGLDPDFLAVCLPGIVLSC